MRLIARRNLADYWAKHPKTRSSLERWIVAVEGGRWRTMSDVQRAFPKAKVLNSDRIRFELADGHRLVVGFKFKNQIAFVKFVGTHAEYDRVDALGVAQF